MGYLMLYSTKQEEGAVLPKHMDLKFSEFMASADGGRSKRQMVNITSNIFILLRKAKQHMRRHRGYGGQTATSRNRKQQIFCETWPLLSIDALKIKCMCHFYSIICIEQWSMNLLVNSRASSQLWGLGCTSSALHTPYETSPPPPPPSDQHSRWVHSGWSRRTYTMWTCTTDTH